MSPAELATGGLTPEAFAPTLDAALTAGDVAAFQLRLKDVPDSEIERAVAAFMPVTSRHDVAFILNDRPELAARLDCDGVHVGQDDMPYDEARAILGEDRIVGVTCKNSRHLAMVAGESGADYVAFGAFFPTTTKDSTVRAEPSIIAWWSRLMEVPCVAIGGITPENCAPLIAAGADFLCVSGGVWHHAQGPEAAVRALTRQIAETEVTHAGWDDVTDA